MPTDDPLICAHLTTPQHNLSCAQMTRASVGTTFEAVRVVGREVYRHPLLCTSAFVVGRRHVDHPQPVLCTDTQTICGQIVQNLLVSPGRPLAAWFWSTVMAGRFGPWSSRRARRADLGDGLLGRSWLAQTSWSVTPWSALITGRFYRGRTTKLVGSTVVEPSG